GDVERGVLASGVDRVGVVAGRLDVPDALELPGPGRAVVPEMVDCRALVGEVVADHTPRLATVVGTLHHLPEPAVRRRRGIEPIRIGGRPGYVVGLPATEMRPVDLPFLTRGV